MHFTLISERRRFLDRAVFNRRGEYMPLAQDYDKVLKNGTYLRVNARYFPFNIY